MQGTILPGITRKGIMEAAQDCGYEVNDYSLSATSGFCFLLLLFLLLLL
jgi:branched-subunit amino acid aminotransferase/4-amino-4-deoxychorismate lyase